MTSSSSTPSNLAFRSLCWFSMVIVLVFCTFISNPNLFICLCLLVPLVGTATLLPRQHDQKIADYRVSVHSEQVLLRQKSFHIAFIMSSRSRLKSDDNPHSCCTPDVSLNHSVSSPSNPTALTDLLYNSSIVAQQLSRITPSRWLYSRSGMVYLWHCP